jgi:hypothetical protein
MDLKVQRYQYGSPPAIAHNAAPVPFTPNRTTCVSVFHLIVSSNLPSSRHTIPSDGFSRGFPTKNKFEPPIQWVPGALILGVNWPGREADHSPPSSAEVKDCAELYLHSPIRLHGVVLG